MRKLETFNWKIVPGYTFAELIIVMAVFVTLIGLATINLTAAKQQASLNTSIDILVSDMRGQQIKAMIGDTEGRATSDHYGIHFESDRYVLFHGSTYSAADTSNFTVELGDNITFTGTPVDLVFSRVTGEVPVGGSFTLRDNTTQSEKTVQYNKYGTVTAVD